MREKPYEQILSEIETHCSNAAELLKKSYKIHMSALDSEDANYYISETNRAVEFQTLSLREMQKAPKRQPQ